MKNSIYSTDGISLSGNITADLNDICRDFPSDKIFVLLDQNTSENCRKRLELLSTVPEQNVIIIQDGESNKNLDQVQAVWQFLGEQMADRKSLLVNVGGGMLTDLGGFAASTYKRGIQFINVPTTLLAMVDASVGGKTGVNFRGLKNEVGLIRQALHVFLYPPFLETLDDENLRSGFAEMLKSALIKDPQLWNDLKAFNLDARSYGDLAPLLWRSVMIKKEIVDLDPNENGIRKALNFGHTVGHALESQALHTGRKMMHGYAVAYGMSVEARLSGRFSGLTEEDRDDIIAVIRKIYGKLPEQIQQQKELIDYMRFDKKNERNQINFTLLNKIGSCEVNNFISEEDISKTLAV
ncbi:MAG: 3-dehydroquinate synthase [Bacteroidetes bacterium]|nr:3-dehydroquinate synthase [Bacteroidota bacterium]MBT4397849.1 3-dehydroquinate synthase [Bacteroidota bacterium]MBT4412224.1 3-dehydroquinate synthase [Bacteroidota bacterium]MBT7095088.1 3-dehydroquinate synthase [Bacteroidota bacterium]MBT7464493.1 3-dehydroquinate synthase [Bacteroidota bacterium]